VPLALGWGADPSFRSPMAITVIGGLITSDLIEPAGGAGRLHLYRRPRRTCSSAAWQNWRRQKAPLRRDDRVALEK